MVVIRTPINMFKEVEKMLHYRFWDKERERSNRAAAMAASGRISARCVMRHDQYTYTGPPNDHIRAYVCLRCHAVACEPEIRDRGFDFDTLPDWEMNTIFDLDLERQAKGNPKMFAMNGHGL